MAAADLNGDGKLDLLLLDTGSPGVVTLLGNGDGTFQAPVSVPSGGAADYVAIGDFNGDGNPDIATASLALSIVTVLLGKGNGTFGPPSSYVAPSAPTSLVLADFNADGKLDIIVGNGAPDLLTGSTDSDEMAVLYGNGDGTFEDAPLYLLPKSPTSVAIADFDGDGKPDAAIGYQLTQQVSLFKGEGKSQFQPLPNYSLSSPSTALVAGDFNGDGKPDLASRDRARSRLLLERAMEPMGGANAQVLYAGPQGAFVGEDQVNVLIPRSLAGSGSVPVVLTAYGESSNAVNVTIQ